MAIKDWIPGTRQTPGITITKLNPAQAAIASSETNSSAEDIINYQTAYDDIEIINRSIDLIINAAVSIPFKVQGAGALDKVDKLLNFKPNAYEDRVKFFRRAFLDFYLDGNVFFYYDGSEIYILPANNVEIIPDERTYIKGYKFTVVAGGSDLFNFGKTDKKNNDVIDFTPKEIIHIRADNSTSIYRGQSRLHSMEQLFELYYYLTKFQRQFFKNNAVPGIVLQTDNVLSPKIKDRILEQWRMTYSTLFNGARNPAILDGGLKIDKFSNVSFSELDFENSVERVQQDMSKALGVPYVLLKSGNNANIDANQKLFYAHTVVPLLEMFSSAFSHFFTSDRGPMQITPDQKSVAALQPDLKTQASYHASLVNSGIITPNESRLGLGFPQSEDAKMDEIRIPQNITGSATRPNTGGRPTGEETTD